MPEERYVIRRFVAVRKDYVMEDLAYAGRAPALPAASHRAMGSQGVVVINRGGRIVASFGDALDRFRKSLHEDGR